MFLKYCEKSFPWSSPESTDEILRVFSPLQYDVRRKGRGNVPDDLEGQPNERPALFRRNDFPMLNLLNDFLGLTVLKWLAGQ